MLKIGAFARQAHVTVKTLRHYARLGLLKPAWVDRFSGYRFYTLDQFSRLEHIREMQALGFTLEQIKGMLEQDLNTQRWRELLTRKRIEVIQKLRSEEVRLQQVEILLAQTQSQTLSTNPIQKERSMEAQFVTKPAMVVVGMRYQGKNANNEIAQLWQQFNPRAHEIKHILPDAALGLCIMAEGLPEGEFEYIAGYAVKQIDQLPEGMVVRIVPAYTYAVFAHRGSFVGLRKTYQNLYQVWLPEIGLKPIDRLDMEVYTDEFKDFAEDSVFYIYVPVKEG